MALLYEKRGRIAYVTINRPEALNAIDPQTYKEFSQAMMDFRDDTNCRVAIITGSGDRAFSAGADIKEMLPLLWGIRNEWWRLPPFIVRGLELWKPLIAAVNGIALGAGLEISLACDVRIAAENAIFGVPEVKLGVIPGWGGTQRLPRAIPAAKAAMIVGSEMNLQDGLRLETKLIDYLFTTQDHREARQAFLEKRKPVI